MKLKKKALGLDNKHTDVEQQRRDVQLYINLKLASTGQPYSKRHEFMVLADDLLQSYREKNRHLLDYLCPIDQRIQDFLDSYLSDCLSVGKARLPSNSLVLDKYGMARELSLPADSDEFSSDIVKSYRVRQGILHNPANDRRTTEGSFHIAEGGLPIPGDKKAVPKIAFARLLLSALNPPDTLLELPFTANETQRARLFVSLLLRPVICPEIPNFQPEKSMEIRCFAPGNLVSNLDFLESIFGNAGNPYLADHDAALDVDHWSGHTGCIILAPHLTQLTKQELGLPHYDEATARQRKDFLIECLGALKRQSVRVDAIYIIDNASTDATPLKLMESGYLSELPSTKLAQPLQLNRHLWQEGRPLMIHYVRMPVNSGGAGGFHEGVKRAFADGYHWLWMMDDDVEPFAYALEQMLSFSQMSRCIQPTKRFRDGSTFPDHAYFDMSYGKLRFLQTGEFAAMEKFSCKNYGTFEGMLVHRSVVKEIGLPDKRFFIVGDDFIYGLLASFHTNNILIKEPLFEKKIKRSPPQTFLRFQSVRLKDMELYYTIRNRFIIFEYLKELGTLSRFAWLDMLASLVKALFGVIVFDRCLHRLVLVFKGFLDGFFKKYNLPGAKVAGK